MRLALAQMSMQNDMERNFNKTMQFLNLADTHNADLVVFPECCLTPYFPQFKRREVGGELNHIPGEFAIELSDEKITSMSKRAAEYKFYVCPNFYINDGGAFYDMSLWIDAHGKVRSRSKRVHVANMGGFYEEDYFTPAKDGFFVYDTPFGKVGIVIGFDRHFPESIRACARLGAELIIIPAANTSNERLDMYECELRAAAYDNCVFVAMANRVGVEGSFVYAGQSMVISPEGEIVVKADDSQQFIICNIELGEARIAAKKRPYIKYLRKEMYGYGSASESK